MSNKPFMLLVENDYITAFITLKYFEKHFSCVHVKGAEEALHITKETAFDLILLDINLGDSSFDGVRVMTQMRANPQLARTKICAFTSYHLPNAEEGFLSLGFDHYIQKASEYEGIAEMLLLSLQGQRGNGASA
jgi:CheY-like chemotaxis protein